jgi:hypothetical protein
MPGIISSGQINSRSLIQSPLIRLQLSFFVWIGLTYVSNSLCLNFESLATIDWLSVISCSYKSDEVGGIVALVRFEFKLRATFIDLGRSLTYSSGSRGDVFVSSTTCCSVGLSEQMKVIETLGENETCLPFLTSTAFELSSTSLMITSSTSSRYSSSASLRSPSYSCSAFSDSWRLATSMFSSSDDVNETSSIDEETYSLDSSNKTEALREFSACNLNFSRFSGVSNTNGKSSIYVFTCGDLILKRGKRSAVISSFSRLCTCIHCLFISSFAALTACFWN